MAELMTKPLGETNKKPNGFRQVIPKQTPSLTWLLKGALEALDTTIKLGKNPEKFRIDPGIDTIRRTIPQPTNPQAANAPRKFPVATTQVAKQQIRFFKTYSDARRFIDDLRKKIEAVLIRFDIKLSNLPFTAALSVENKKQLDSTISESREWVVGFLPKYLSALFKKSPPLVTLSNYEYFDATFLLNLAEFKLGLDKDRPKGIFQGVSRLLRF